MITASTPGATGSAPAVNQSVDLLTVPDVMARMQVSRHTVYQLIRTRRLSSVTIGRCRRIPVAALAAYLSSLTSGS